MLHLIFQSPLDTAILGRIDGQDSVVLMQNAVFQSNKNHRMAIHFQQLMKTNVQIYVMRCDLDSRGLMADDILTGVEPINYTQLVDLTTENKVVRTWN